MDDPASRLRELEGFEELAGEPDEDEMAAVAGAAEMSLEHARMASLGDDEAALRPYAAAIDRILFDPPNDHALPVIILPHLLLGDACAAHDVEKLRALGVTHVLNAAGEDARGPVDDYASCSIDYMQLDAEDNLLYDISQHRAVASEFIRGARACGGRCLLHCFAGVNRSGFLACAEVIVTEGRPLLEAVRHCCAARGPLLWNPSFRIALVRLAKDHGLLGEQLVENAMPTRAAAFAPGQQQQGQRARPLLGCCVVH